MIDADERSCLRHTVALQHRETESVPELFGVRIECCAARHESPELPAEATMYLAKSPPPTKSVMARSSSQSCLKTCNLSARFHPALHLLAQRVEHARDRS